MSNSLYLECFSGISGDMAVAALLDLGADQRKLETALESLPVKGFKVRISRVKKAGLDVCDFAVILDQKHENHDHDMEYLHGHDHSHEHDHGHSHDHSHEVRRLDDICALIEQADLSVRAKSISVKIFDILAQAEAKAHGVDKRDVHFHEVGAVDSIVDIVAVAVCMDSLDITQVIVPVLYEGCGSVRCQHGILPVPVPAVAHIVSENNLRLHMTGMQGEFVTPTGAAIVAAVKTGEKLPDQFKINKIGIGAGKREYEKPSLLRAMLISNEERQTDEIYKLETNIDDCTGEALGYAMEKLLSAGARDVHYIPVMMKKNRPAYQLNVICKEQDIPALEEIIFLETTTIGIRRQKMERSIVKREVLTVDTELGKAQVKVCTLPGDKRYYPEYESVAALCKSSKKSYQEVYRLIERACDDEL